MVYLIIFLSFMFGTIIGSFLNVVVFRMGTGMGIGGRSMCLSCNRNLHWYELIPVISFLLQSGKCRICKTKISWQYPMVEFFTGALFAISTFFLWQNVPLLVVSFILISLGVIIAAYDAKHKIIHLPALVAFFITGTLFNSINYFQYMDGVPFSLLRIIGLLIGALIVALPFFIMWAVSRGRWIGFGDVEIIAVAGWLLGISGGYSSVMLGFWIACLVILQVYGYFKFKKKLFNHQVPMAPFLLLGIYLVLISGLNVFNLIGTMIY